MPDHTNNANTTSGPPTSISDFAQLYTGQRHWFVFPTPPDGKLSYLSKEDNGNRWGATNDPEVAKQYFKTYRQAGIGIACGESKIFVLDVDTLAGHGVDGIATLRRIEAENGVLPVTLMSRSPTGSLHYYFNMPADRIVGLSKLGDGIDVKGEGGMVMAPPTVRNGGAYEWLNDNPIADAPKWLLDMVAVEREERPFVDRSPDTIGPNAVLVPDLLNEIDPNDLDRPEWFQVGCAVYAELGQQGREVFQQWTSRGSKYDRREDSRQWNDIVDRSHGYNCSYITLERIHDKVTETDPLRVMMLRLVQQKFAPVVKESVERPWPVMTDDAYHGFVGEVVRCILPHSEADAVALLLQFLTCFGNVVYRCHYYQVENDQHHAVLFIVLVGETGNRKGTALNRIKSIFKAAAADWLKDRIRGGLASGEGLIHSVRDAVFKIDDDGKVREVDPGAEDKRLLLMEPEFAALLSVIDRGGQTTSHLMRQAWDGGVLSNLNKNTPETASSAHISCIGHITQDELRAKLTRTEMCNGFANRFLWPVIKRSKLLPHGGNLAETEIIRLGDKLKTIIDQMTSVPEPSRVTMTDAARAEWERIYEKLSHKRGGLLGAITARAEAQTIRLALIYALLDQTNKIDLPHLKAGLAVWNYCEASATYIFGDTLGDETADAILRALINAGAEGMTKTAISGLFGNNRRAGQIAPAIDLLVRHGRARVGERHNPTGGRPSVVVFAC